jgi:hypothetical protein
MLLVTYVLGMNGSFRKLFIYSVIPDGIKHFPESVREK